MDAQQLTEFAKQARMTQNNMWEEGALRGLSSRTTPVDILGSQAWLLEADIKVTWLRWFLDSLIDSRRFLGDESLGYSHLYFEVRNRIQQSYRSTPADELAALEVVISELLWEEIAQARQSQRIQAPRDLREKVWLDAEPEPRCYLCGYRFTSMARDRFLDRTRTAIDRSEELPLLVDFTRPRGVRRRDLSIEIDHVIPVAGGGLTTEGNLRLACGWCNMIKSNRRTLYDSSASPAGHVRIASFGSAPIPQPLWVLRIVATRRRCEDNSGCSARLENSELFIAPGDSRGVLNPVSARVYCDDHDPWSNVRYVGRTLLQKKLTKPAG